jgi:DNA mismatch repair protein MutS
MLVTAEDSVFNCSNLNENILSAFNITALNNIEYNSFLELYSLNVLLNYIEYTQQTSIKFNTLPVCYSLNSYMNIDLDSRINLELCENLSDNTSKRSLYDVLNYCKTSMGCRLLKQWIETPLLNRGKIERRLKGVSELCLDKSALSDAHKSLLGILDISRIIGRLKLNRITPNDFINLRSSLQKIPMLKSYMQSYSSEILNSLYNNLDNYDAITSFLEAAFMDNPAGDIKDGLVLKAGFNTELDAARDLITDSNKYINEFESNERRRTGIKKLKVVMKSGKCVIEVKNSKDNAMLIPADYELEKSLKSSTQYVNSDTRQLESSLLSATERSKQIEIELYEQIKDAVLSESNKFTILSNVIAEFDVLCSLAQAAVNNNYVCPTLNTDGVLDIQNGRHPVVEKLVKESFVDNDVYMNETTDRFLLITGPNMAGKSTYMRQIALIVLMAHMGSFIPASNANIPLTDKIFTRIGASDNIGSGRSTYMVEMVEVKNILENATRNSLVLLDEVGRGTSTLDGISIAQSLTEYIHNRIGCKTLFATHYHELIELDKTLSGLKNYHMSAFKEEDGLHFIRKIERGGITKSYGIDVAEMAGIPKEVIDRSLEILHTLEVKCGTVHYLSEEESEYSLLDVTYSSNTEQIMNTLKSFKGARLSPFECYNVLNELIDLVGDK